jgi:1-acyl-sn-glycerol-3-phosphate acyltransferase
MKPQVYKDPRPAEEFDRFHERVRTKEPDLMYDLVRVLLTPYLGAVYRTWVIDSHNVPKDGPAILAPNHFSFLDHFFLAVYLRRKVQFMAKSQLFKWPMQFVFSHGGVFPVLRGRGDESAFETARSVLDREGIVVMYCEGGRSRSGELGEVRPGIGRLALESGVKVVPTAIAGSSGVRDWKKLKFPKVTVRYGDPIRFEPITRPTREQAQRASETVFSEVKSMYYGLQRKGRKEVVRAARATRRRAGAATP